MGCCFWRSSSRSFCSVTSQIEREILMDNLNQIISDLQSENKRLEGELKRVRGAIAVLRKLGGGKGAVVGFRAKRQLSVAARKRIAQAQKIRWAKWKAKKAA